MNEVAFCPVLSPDRGRIPGNSLRNSYAAAYEVLTGPESACDRLNLRQPGAATRPPERRVVITILSVTTSYYEEIMRAGHW